ncbi:PEP-CTERM sorting domain-containing protein [Thiocystis violascens]|nr:PEP-CTERM sorting domain-containing protein [Thiocystis violascens]
MGNLDVGGSQLQQSSDSLEGYGANWFFRFDYQINGYSTASVSSPIDMTTVTLGQEFLANEGLIPTFTDGILKIFIDAPSAASPLNSRNNQQVLEMKLTNGGAEIANLDLLGYVDYTWYELLPVDSFIEDLFNFQVPKNGLTSFYDIWKHAQVNNLADAAINWDLNTNLTPNLIPMVGGNGNYPVALVNNAPPCAAGTACRSTALNTDIGFYVPEPGSLALLGAGLFGFGGMKRAASRRRQQP